MLTRGRRAAVEGVGTALLIAAFGPLSGAHFNPLVTLALAGRGEFDWRDVPSYIVSQVAGALAGVAAANVMFGAPAFQASTHARPGAALFLGEIVATFGLLSIVFACARSKSSSAPAAVAGYITAAYWFTSSTSFANPAVTAARSLTDSFAGIRPADAPGFVAAQAIGAALAFALFRWLAPAPAREAA